MEEVLEVKPRLDSYSSGRRNAVLQLIPSALPANSCCDCPILREEADVYGCAYDPIDTQVKSKLGWSEKMLHCRVPPIPLAS